MPMLSRVVVKRRRSRIAAQGNSPIPIACSGTADAPLKLVDFGISGVVRADHPNKRLLTRRAGTDGYMAPEAPRLDTRYFV